MPNGKGPLQGYLPLDNIPKKYNKLTTLERDNEIPRLCQWPIPFEDSKHWIEDSFIYFSKRLGKYFWIVIPDNKNILFTYPGNVGCLVVEGGRFRVGALI